MSSRDEAEIAARRVALACRGPRNRHPLNHMPTLMRRCVHRFDHHCVWLNSCVGSANYAAFVTLLASAAAMLAVEIALCIYLIVQFATSQTAFAAQVASFYPALPGGAFFGLAVAVLVVALAAWVLVLQLLSFHVFLSASSLRACRSRRSTPSLKPTRPPALSLSLSPTAVRRGLTTYDFIMGKTSSSSAPAPAPAPAPVPAPAPQPAVTESKATPFPSPHVNLLSAYRAPGLGISASASSAAAAAAAADSNTGVEVVGIVGSVEGACATAPDAGAAHDERNSRRLSLPVLG